MADSLFVVLRKLADSLGERALERISTELVEAAPVLTDYEHSMKQIEAELLILQAFIAQAGAKVGDKAFDAWLDQVRDVAHEVEDTIDEGVFSFQKFSPQNIILNLAAHAWSIKCRRNKKLIAQFTVKSRDESFKPN